MSQDDFVVHASEGDMKNVRKGLEEKRLCSVKGTHQEKVMTVGEEWRNTHLPDWSTGTCCFKCMLKLDVGVLGDLVRACFRTFKSVVRFVLKLAFSFLEQK